MPRTTTLEAVYVVTDSETGDPVAIVRKNGSIKWFTAKEASWGDLEKILNVITPTN